MSVKHKGYPHDMKMVASQSNTNLTHVLPLTDSMKILLKKACLEMACLALQHTQSPTAKTALYTDALTLPQGRNKPGL